MFCSEEKRRGKGDLTSVRNQREEKDSGRGTNDKKHCFWSKEYMIASETKGLYTPVALTERGEILLWTVTVL
ncbi:hypothetical protein C5167_010810 [Papaver somniferum]|uniref:Uncharacterized protein n=1 Tax=Papaver somniferum TaxID=3469 RepID=A0A4Y7K425_PAPSO|nr:hypothetical protein C5167_010810 [Papaver somniferum]